MTLGPFDITTDRIEALGLRFTEFVNRLLVLEQRTSGLAGHLLTISNLESVADGGVDAATRDAMKTDWLPAGDTAWQFKRSDLSPAKCAAELRNATWAHEFLRNGGAYVMALGKGLTDRARENRRLRLATIAIELGVMGADDRARIRVYDGNVLAGWASRYPSLAVSKLTGGPGSVAIDYTTWSAKRVHQRTWTPDPDRETAISVLRETVTATGIVDIRVQGDSGIGKSRLVLEALRSDELSPLVAYVDDPTGLSGELLEHLFDDRRTAILVVDECPPDKHAKLVDKLPANAGVKLITIGETGAAQTPTPIFVIDRMPDGKVEEFLQKNFRTLSPEARRFIAAHSRGNMRWTIVLAERVSRADAAQAAELIRRDDITTFITSVLPEGADFFCSAVLALLNRVGWDRELRYQLEMLAGFVGRPVTEFDDLGRQLERLGLLAKHGRYRSIEPHPLAVFLSAEAWRTDGARIVDELLPKLDDEMALAFFERVADLGRFEPARSVLPALLYAGGPFSSLPQIEQSGLGRLLTQLAIVLPDEVALHIGQLIESESVEALGSYTRSRRDLVWTLEKLAWHRRTFEVAASALLRLALAETESYANNATGTWIGLFGTMLPGTAATPSERSQYLQEGAADPRPVVRLLVIRAASQAFVSDEVITVSGELQSGVLVEPRGTPATLGEARDYREVAISILEGLTHDEDADVRRSAEDALIGALAALLHDPVGVDRLIESLSRLEGQARLRVRAEAERLLRRYDRSKADDKQAIERLKSLLAKLPEPDQIERLSVLARLQRWDMEDGELQSQLDELLRAVEPSELASVFKLLDQEVPAAWELGHALAVSGQEQTAILEALLPKFERNPAALAGYLAGRVEAGDARAFDSFLDSHAAAALDLRAQVFLAVRGPVTDRARSRILSALHNLPVATGTLLLFGWRGNLDESDVASIVAEWIDRVESQADYNALVDWLNLWLHGKTALPEALREPSLRLLLMRRNYPGVSQQAWDWARIAEHFVDSNAEDIARVILDCIDPGSDMIHNGDDDSRLLMECARRRPEAIWMDVADRLEKGSWRIQMQIGGWFLNAMAPDIVREWVGDNVNRARLVAAIVPLGSDEPTPLVRFLLERFGGDRQVSVSLSSGFVTGFWTGPESAHLSQQIARLNGWRERSTQPLAVRDWARTMVEYLETQRGVALEREAEEKF